MAKTQNLVGFLLMNLIPDGECSFTGLSGRFLELSAANGIQIYVYIYICYQYLCLWLKSIGTKTVVEMENNVNGTFCSLQEKIQINFDQRDSSCFFKVKSPKSPAELSLRLWSCSAAGKLASPLESLGSQGAGCGSEMLRWPQRSNDTLFLFWLGCFLCTKGLVSALPKRQQEAEVA